MADQKLGLDAPMELLRSIRRASSYTLGLKDVPSRIVVDTVACAIAADALKIAFRARARFLKNKLLLSVFSLFESFICSG